MAFKTLCKGLYKTFQSPFIVPLPLDVHVVRLETTKPVPFESLSLPLCIQRANAAVALSVAVVVYIFGMAMTTHDSCAPSAQSSGGMAKWALAIIMVSGFVKFVGQRGDMVMKAGMMNSKAMETMIHWRNWSQIQCSHF